MGILYKLLLFSIKEKEPSGSILLYIFVVDWVPGEFWWLSEFFEEGFEDEHRTKKNKIIYSLYNY